jgi:sortase A
LEIILEGIHLVKFKLSYLIVGLCVLIVGVAFAAVVFSGKEVKTNLFQKDEISFNYPNTWTTMNKTQDSQIVAFTDPKSNLSVTVNRQLMPVGYSPSENFTMTVPENLSGYKFISHQTLNQNGNQINSNVYQMKVKGKTIQITELWINKNNALYSIIYSTNNLDLNVNSPEIKALTRNLTIQNTTLPNTVVIGQVSMPSLGLNWNISDDTVNHYGSVYHVANSFYPGQNGTVGLLGHHTRYSAPFNNTYQLNAGDQVIITDYLTQKKYIYTVIKNGDIKSDYKTNPVQFAAGTYGLTMITCYPPGFMEAAYQTHLNLVSVMPI